MCVFIYIFEIWIESLLCDTDRWPSGRVSDLQSVVAGLISSVGDHSMHCWWDPIRSKQLSSVPYVTWKCLLDFLVMVIQLTYIYIYICMYVCVLGLSYLPNPSTRTGYDTRSIFKQGFNRFWIQSFPSPRLVALPRLNNPVFPTIYP